MDFLKRIQQFVQIHQNTHVFIAQERKFYQVKFDCIIVVFVLEPLLTVAVFELLNLLEVEYIT